MHCGLVHGGDQHTKKSRTNGFSSELNANVNADSYPDVLFDITSGE